MVEGEQRPIRISRYFCTICGRQYYGPLESHFYIDHVNIKKRYLPMYIEHDIKNESVMT